MLDAALTAQMDMARSQAANPRLPTIAKDSTIEQVRDAAIEFEAVFLGQMFAEMWAGVEVDPMFGGGHQEEMFRDMMVREMGKQVARSGGIGLADDIAAEMIRIQERAQ